MKKCNDYWCEYYGKDNGKCAHCEEKERVKNTSDLRVILQRRAIESIELSKMSNKNQVQER
jgi:hypothetical protein